MTSRRVLKVAEAIREVVSMSILTELKDPRIQNVTVTHVEVTSDLRQARVHVSVMGSEQEQQLSLHGLQSAAGFLQQKVGKRMDTRYIPRLRFELDMGVKKSIRILDDLARERGERENSDSSSTEHAPDDVDDSAASTDESGLS